MNNNEENDLQNYKNISRLFLSLADNLRKYKFHFCAYVVDEAYCFYRAEVKKRFQNKVN